MPPPLAPPGSPNCSSPYIHHSRSGSDPFWMSLVASVASQNLHSRHLHSVWAALGLPHRHKVSALTPNLFRPLRWVVRTAVAGPAADVTSAAGTLFYYTQGNPEPGQKDPTHQDAAYAHHTPIAANGHCGGWSGQMSRGRSRCHICCWHTFLPHPGQPRTRANRPDPSRRRIRTPDPDCCEWVISAPLAASCCAAGVPRYIGCRSAEYCPQVVYRLGPAAESSTSPLALVRHLS